MIAAHHAALENRPEAFDGICMHRANNVLTPSMIDRLMRIAALRIADPKRVVDLPLIGADQANAARDSLAHESKQGCRVNGTDYLGDDVALALHRADDWRLAGTDTTAAATLAAAALPDMAILSFAANKRFVNFYNANELKKFLVLHRSAKAMAHIPRCFIGTESERALDLQCAHAFLARHHHVQHAKPIAQRFVRVLKDRARNVREAICMTFGAIGTFPFPLHRLEWIRLGATASRAVNAIRPAPRDEIRAASVLVGERYLKLRDSHLMDNGFRRFSLFHMVSNA